MAASRRNLTSCQRFQVLTCWLAFTAPLAASANPGRAAVTVSPTCRVEGQPEVELTLNCGDGKNAGVVQYWHTPFGDLQTTGFLSKLNPVFMHHDGSLVVPNTSSLHSGLYYCLLRHTEGTTLWPYDLRVGHRNSQKDQERSAHERPSGCGAFRFRRDAGSEAERQAGVSDGQFAGAVAASVLLTFVLGFSAGALSRTYILRCLGAVTTRLRSPRKQRQTDKSDQSSEVTMTTLPSMSNNQPLEMEKADASSTTSPSPPTKPQRSFRQKQQEEQETTAYLEGCDYAKDKGSKMEEEVAGRSLEERDEVCDGEEEEEDKRGFYVLGGSQTDTDEEKCSEDGEEEDGRESREDKREWREEGEVEEAGAQDNRSEEGGEGRKKSEEETGDDKVEVEEDGWKEEKKEDDGDSKREEDDGDSKREEDDRDSKSEEDDGDSKREEDDGDSKSEEDDGDSKREEDDGDSKSKEDDGDSKSEEDEETGSKNNETGSEQEIAATDKEPTSSPPRRSRVIRLYQYDDDGQRYRHLPDPGPAEPGPAPRLKQRSLSLTRLSAIMAAASAGPLDTRETGKEEKPHFHMEI